MVFLDVVAPIIERRTQLKQKRQSKGDMFDQQQNALKWLLVTCFGYTGYKNARFGRIEAHEVFVRGLEKFYFRPSPWQKKMAGK